MSVKRCSFIYFVCLPIWKLKELIYMFGSSYKKVNTSPEEVSLGTVHYLLVVRDRCSVGKTHGKSSCPVNKNFKKVGVPSVEGRKKSMSCIITLYSHCVRGAICNDPTYSLGVWGCCKPLEALKPLHFIGSERV